MIRGGLIKDDLDLKQRKIGVEIELGNMTPEFCAEIISKNTNWKTEQIHDDLFLLKSPQGDYKVETDAEIIKKMSKEAMESEGDSFSNLIREGFDSLKGTLVPIEIVSPPLPLDKISDLDQVCEELHNHGAKGTQDSFNYAFGLHLNPQVKDLGHTHILKNLQSFIILSDWLHDQIRIDTTRRLTGFAKDFPKDYAKKIIQTDYKPNQTEFIDDYLDHNPTRNRSLDMLPLLKFLDSKRVTNIVDDTRVKSRPTYHYRLPNCMLGSPFWSINTEWKRWKKVEWLAENETSLNAAIKAFNQIKLKSSFSNNEWLSILNNLIMESE